MLLQTGEVGQDGAKEGLVGVGRGALDDHAAHRLLHPGSDLQQPQAKGVHRGGGELGSGGRLAHVPQENVGHGVQKEPELVGLEPVATRAAGLEVELEFLDPVFGFAAADVELVVDPLGSQIVHVGHDKSGVGALGEVFHLGHDAAGMLPGVGLVGEGREGALLFPGGLVGLAGLFDQRGDAVAKAGVGNEADRVGDVQTLQGAVEVGDGKAAVGPHEDVGFGVALLQPGENPSEDVGGAFGGMGPAGAQHGGQGVAGEAVEDEKRMEHVLAVEAVEEGELLAAVGGIVGGIDVDDDQAPGAGVGGDVGFDEEFGNTDQLFSGDAVFEPAQGGLGGEIGGRIGGAPGGDFEGGVGAQGVVVVGVLVAEGDGEGSMQEEGVLVVSDLAGIAGVMEAGRDVANEADAAFDLLQEEDTGIGGNLAAIEGGDDGFAAEVCKGELGVTVCTQRALLCWHVFLRRNNMLEGARSLVYTFS